MTYTCSREQVAGVQNKKYIRLEQERTKQSRVGNRIELTAGCRRERESTEENSSDSMEYKVYRVHNRIERMQDYSEFIEVSSI